MMYDDDSRGAIRYRNRARQIIDFRGIRCGKVTPTDMDGYFEKNDKLYVFYEFKLRNAELPDGQSRSQINLVNALAETGRIAVLFVCRHEVDDPEEDIDAASTIVDKFYYNGMWYKGKHRTAKEITDKFYKRFIEQGYAA